ncbi:hypothetical protein JOQ06_009659, partial [Pogonophryne albipinna]
ETAAASTEAVDAPGRQGSSNSKIAWQEVNTATGAIYEERKETQVGDGDRERSRLAGPAGSMRRESGPLSGCTAPWGGGRKRGENRGNKLVLLLTVHQIPGAIILPAEGLDAEAGPAVMDRWLLYRKLSRSIQHSAPFRQSH